MSARDEQVAAVRRRLSDLATDWDRWEPVLRDDFDAIDAHAPTEQAAGDGIKIELTGPPPVRLIEVPAKPAPRRRTAK